jgi:cyclopropane fatty-acyl-phospholipid synthase-like methyltransferase
MFIPEHSPHPSHPATGPDDLYAAKPPWDIDRAQPAFLALAEGGQIRGRVLDIGCGTGEHALMAAGLGHAAVGVDQSAHALELADRKARDRGITVTFIRYDACKLADLGETFDTVLDCGLFHIFSDAARGQYVDSLRAVVRPQGRYFMLGFSDAQPGDWGPRRLTRDEIEAAFTDGWRIDGIEPAVIEINVEPVTVAAWVVQLTRT